MKKVISPHSHVWKKLKRIRKGTSCQFCGATEDLWAYRGPYNTQTVCGKHLEEGKRSPQGIIGGDE